MSQTFRYRAFISYSHSDKRFARKLQRLLEGYELPKSMRGDIDRPRHPLYPIFRDEAELVPGQDLPRRIQRGLEQSEFLIVVCSPSAARSEWVDREVVSFSKLGRSSNILTVLKESHARTNDGSYVDSLPRSLRFSVATDGATTEHPQPLWVDLRRGSRIGACSS